MIVVLKLFKTHIGETDLKKIHNIPLKIAATVWILIYAVILYFSPINCIVLSLTGIPCLGCGMTRALISALKFDFAAAFSYHLMFWSVPLLYICFLLDGRLFKNKKCNLTFYLVILIGFITNWLFHWIF